MLNPFTVVLVALFSTVVMYVDANDETPLHSDLINRTMNSIKEKNALAIPWQERHGGLRWKHMQVIGTISLIALAIMIVIVVTLISHQYKRNQRIKNADRADQRLPMYTEPLAPNVDPPISHDGK